MGLRVAIARNLLKAWLLIAVPAAGAGVGGWTIAGYRLALLFAGSVVLVGLALYAYADRIARRFATDHRTRIVSPDDYGLADTLAFHFDEPFADASALPTYRVCELAREQDGGPVRRRRARLRPQLRRRRRHARRRTSGR